MIFPLLVAWFFSQADLEYSRGMALARAQHWDEAAARFREGQRLTPGDKRFPLELAGVAFKRRDFAAARKNIGRALELDPRDAYANEFAGTLYFLDGNIDAALTFWNRIGKPRVAGIRTEPESHLDPVLVDRAFSFAPASTLALEEYRATRARLQLLDAFPAWKLTLDARATGDNFDAVLHTMDTRSWLTALRGLPFLTVYPELRNPDGHVFRIASMLRWDSQKRRAGVALSGPLLRSPQWHYRLFFDGRNENWIVPRVGGFNLKRTETGGEITSLNGDRWKWSAGAAFTHRRFTSTQFTSGSALETFASIEAAVLRAPVHRFDVTASGDWRLGRFFDHGAYTKTQGSLAAHWFPHPRGDDYETTLRVRAGKSTGNVPFDELNILGIERDNNLWLRSHVGTVDGKKGSAPLGPDYLLENWEIDKVVHEGALYSVRIGPFIDTGRVYRGFGFRGWMFDTGLQVKVRVLGVANLAFSWGKDLRTGANAWYAAGLN